ncbi:unnamed protein product [Rodentolepis nana]|uniref:CUPID domain-containing protein n=1 Tax=Rodentolepis nana TaxID=102285 RepID=A0A0R3T0A2_RODNA|nr:unnamed protein product [Rodentolepis nana]
MSTPSSRGRKSEKSEDLFKGPDPASPLIQSGANEFYSEIPTILPVVYEELIRESPEESVLPPLPQVISDRQCRFGKDFSRDRSYDSFTIQEETRKARAELAKLSNLGGKHYPRLGRLLDKISRSAQEEIELFQKQDKYQSLKRTRQHSMPGRLAPSENQVSRVRYSYPMANGPMTPNVPSYSYPEQIPGFNEYSQQILKIQSRMPCKRSYASTPGPQRLRACPMPTQTPIIKKPMAREMSCPPPQASQYGQQRCCQKVYSVQKPPMACQTDDLVNFEKLKEDVQRINRSRINKCNQQIQHRPCRSASQDGYYTYQPGYTMNNQAMSYQPSYGYSQQLSRDTHLKCESASKKPSGSTQNRQVGSYQGYIPGYEQTTYGNIFNYHLPNY